MKTSSEESFVKQLKENQNIIHKICRLYTSDEDAHKDLFQEMVWKIGRQDSMTDSQEARFFL